MHRIPSHVVEQLGHYVYAYVRGDRIAYVGKGVGQRALAHLSRIRGHRIDILAHGLPDERSALAVEAALIEALGLSRLTNRVRGKGIRRESLQELLLRLSARPIAIREPSVLIRVSQLFRPGMSAAELYEITRGVWKIGRRREDLQYAMAVHNGIVREVYRIKGWYRAGSTRYRFRKHLKSPGRFEFIGTPAPRAIRGRYVGRSVVQLLPRGAQNPIRYAGTS